MSGSVRVRAAVQADLPDLVPLFDAYRVFYEQPSAPALAEGFLEERFRLRDSHLLLALDADDVAIGFTQLYPSFSSVAMRRIFVLNDLYVAESGRRSGAGRALLAAAHEFARGHSAVRVSLKTRVDNHPAQQLYRSMGYVLDDQFFAFDLAL